MPQYFKDNMYYFICIAINYIVYGILLVTTLVNQEWMWFAVLLLGLGVNTLSLAGALYEYLVYPTPNEET